MCVCLGGNSAILPFLILSQGGDISHKKQLQDSNPQHNLCIPRTWRLCHVLLCYCVPLTGHVVFIGCVLWMVGWKVKVAFKPNPTLWWMHAGLCGVSPAWFPQQQNLLCAVESRGSVSAEVCGVFFWTQSDSKKLLPQEQRGPEWDGLKRSSPTTPVTSRPWHHVFTHHYCEVFTPQPPLSWIQKGEESSEPSQSLLWGHSS